MQQLRDQLNILKHLYDQIEAAHSHVQEPLDQAQPEQALAITHEPAQCTSRAQIWDMPEDEVEHILSVLENKYRTLRTTQS